MLGYLIRVAGIAAIVAIGAVTARAQSLQQQEICANQAKVYFQENSADDPKLSKDGDQSIGAGYVGHYNTKLNRCFVLVDSTSLGPNGQFFTSTQLVDAFERRIYATYYWMSHKDKKYWEVPPISCELTPTSPES